MLQLQRTVAMDIRVASFLYESIFIYLFVIQTLLDIFSCSSEIALLSYHQLLRNLLLSALYYNVYICIFTLLYYRVSVLVTSSCF